MVLGILSRIDLYTDACFIKIVHSCSQEYPYNEDLKVILIGSIITIILSITIPLSFNLFQLYNLKYNSQNYFIPNVQKVATLSYIAEFKGVGSILGSYCYDLKLSPSCFDVSIPRIHSLLKLVIEDLAQTIWQIYFLSVHNTQNEYTVPVSITFSIVCLIISIFQVVISRNAKASEKLLNQFPQDPDMETQQSIQNFR